MARQSLNNAARQARADALSQLDSIGSNRSEFDTAEVFSVMEKDVANFIERVQDNINAAGISTTGNIADITMLVSDSGINVVGKPYLIYQDKGVQGAESSAKAPNSPFKYTDKKPPASAFVEMIKRKNLNLRNEEFYGGQGSPYSDVDGNDAAIKSLSYAIRETVYKEGFQPKNLFSKEIPQLVQDVSKSVLDFTTNMITSSMRDKKGNDLVKRGTKKID